MRTRYDLLNRYLQAVGKHLLGARQAEDVVNELGANLLAQIEDRERELGRQLAPEDVAAILRQHGSPASIAARYQAEPALIGPELLPIYWRVLKIALYWIVLVDAASYLALRNGARWLLAAGIQVGAPAQMIGMALGVFGAVTLAFMVVDRLVRWSKRRRKTALRWDPISLPMLEPSWRWKRGVYAGFELLPGILAVLYWSVAVPRHPFLMFGMGAVFLQYSPALTRLFWPVLGLLLVELGLDAVGMMYGENTWQRRAKGACAKAVSLGIFALLLKTRGLIVAAPPAYEHIARAVNGGFQTGVVFALWLIALTLVVDLARLARMAAVAKPAR